MRTGWEQTVGRLGQTADSLGICLGQGRGSLETDWIQLITSRDMLETGWEKVGTG